MDRRAGRESVADDEAFDLHFMMIVPGSSLTGGSADLVLPGGFE
jgi:hypothetical protein